MAEQSLDLVVRENAERFREVALSGDAPVAFEQEAEFALQLLRANDYLAKTALAQPQSLRDAMIRVAATGLSLNPAQGLAYLVPRSPKKGAPAQVCLDIGYRGFIKIATDSGAVESVHVDTVYSGDAWEYEERGDGTHLVHKRPRLSADRGTLEGVYCRATLPSGRTIVCVMTATEIADVRKSSPMADGATWGDWYDEMAKKSVVRRAQKTWPKMDGPRASAARAIDAEPEALVGPTAARDVTPPTPPATATGSPYVSPEEVAALRLRIKALHARALKAGAKPPINEERVATAFECDCIETLPAGSAAKVEARLADYERGLAEREAATNAELPV